MNRARMGSAEMLRTGTPLHFYVMDDALAAVSLLTLALPSFAVLSFLFFLFFLSLAEAVRVAHWLASCVCTAT